jgi:pseudouridine-5'-phosphate glycosidase
MTHEVSPHFLFSDIVYEALSQRLPVVALESTVITHGLPYPQNRILALDMEQTVRRQGAVPATVALVDGDLRIGLDELTLERLAQGEGAHKISSRDIGPAIARGWSGGTTVAATMLASHAAGIRVFATGGIGGVHRQISGVSSSQMWDISGDLPQLASTPMVVVCAGAKAILDLPATLEYLETWGVPVVGFGVDEFPAFYSRASDLPVSLRADSASEIVKIARAHWQVGMKSAALVANPPPIETALPWKEVDAAIQKALLDADRLHLHGQAVTPYLLKRVNELTHGTSLEANLSLLTNNAHLAAAIAYEFTRD